MRYLFLFFLFLFSRLCLKAQCDSSIIGVWKPISVITEEIRFDFEDDSVSISKETASYNSDSASQGIRREMIKIMFQDFQYTFNKDGSFEMILIDGVKDQGSYCFDRMKGIIKMTSENSLGELVSIESKASITNGLLNIKIDMGQEEIFEVILKRKKN